MQQIDAAPVEHEDQPKATRAAEILVVGADDWAVNDASSQLLAAGRTVHRCHESAESAFPCNALIPGRGCPLDHHPIDVVLDIRSRPEAQPTLAEMGAICGLRGGIPLVIGGMAEYTGFAPWSSHVPPDGDIVTTCDQAVEARD